MRALLVLLAMVGSLEAIVWRADLPEPPVKQEGEMMQVGKIYHSPLRVFGSSCLAVGGRWVLTSRHGTENYVALGLAVKFPALGDEFYTVVDVKFPEKGDIALLKLSKVVPKAKVLKIFGGKTIKGKRAWIGGYGYAGPAGKVGKKGKFHTGHNRIDGLWRKHISMSLGKPDDKTSEKDEATIANRDSGSPLFIETPEGWRVAGVAAIATDTNGPGYGDRSGYAPMKECAAWFKKQVAVK